VNEEVGRIEQGWIQLALGRRLTSSFRFQFSSKRAPSSFKAVVLKLFLFAGQKKINKILPRHNTLKNYFFVRMTQSFGDFFYGCMI
jgi:hypothetical protein